MTAQGSVVSKQTAGKSGIFGGALANFLASGRKSSDAAVAIGVLGMVALMILPVSPLVLDVLLALNLSIGAIMLVAAVLTPTSQRIYTVPTVLVLTTLFRLGLDVASTRLILTEANAGEVIKSFGQYAAGGNIVVGLVVYLIITLVQLIVISKGAEQTANVNAIFIRETAAMKELSLSQDAAANRINRAELDAARQKLWIEVQFYGRMYGATQFIKGDSVAALVVSAINIVGGLIVGIALNHMELADAAQTYTLLTVGAGLVSQIPALIGSIAGTILVSRISANDATEGGLGDAAYGQVTALPMALMFGGGFLALLGIVPGMPLIPFWILAAAVGWPGYRLRKAASAPKPAVAAPELVIPMDVPPSPSRTIELRLPAKLAQAEIEAVIAGATRVVNGHQDRFGYPLPAWSFCWVTGDNKKIEFWRKGRRRLEGGTWAELEPKLKREFLDNPGEYFGFEEAVGCWTGMLDRHPSFKASLPSEFPEKVLTFPVNVLIGLAEEGFPLKDARGILRGIVLSTGHMVDRPKPNSWSELIRESLGENMGAFLAETYLSEGAAMVRVSEDTRKLLCDPNSKEKSKAAAEKRLGGSRGVQIVVVGKQNGGRRAAWEVLHELFLEGKLEHPPLVLTPAESAATALKQIPVEKEPL